MTLTADFCADDEERRMVARINALRAGRGLPALRFSQTLGAAAEHHSSDMAAFNYFSHTLKDGTSWSRNMTNHGYGFTTYRGENIAAGRADAAGTFGQWEGSPGHFALMVSTRYQAVGVGRAYEAGSTYKWYWTACFGGRFDTPACEVPARVGMRAAGDAEPDGPAAIDVPATEAPAGKHRRGKTPT